MTTVTIIDKGISIYNTTFSSLPRAGEYIQIYLEEDLILSATVEQVTHKINVRTREQYAEIHLINSFIESLLTQNPF